MTNESELIWFVYRIGSDGNWFLRDTDKHRTYEFPTQEAAIKLQEKVTGRFLTAHKQDYVLYNYTPATKREVIDRLRLQLN